MGVPRTLAKGLSKLKEAAELRKLGGTQAERMARAAEQGYDTSRVLYHGSNADIASFADKVPTSKTGNPNAVLGDFFTYDPVEASRYASPILSNKPHLQTGAVYPVFLNRENTYRASYKEMDDMAMELFHNPQNPTEKAKKFREQLIADGYDSVAAKIGGIDEIIMLDPSRIRSVNADFNPAHKDSSNLLAGIGNLAAPLLKTAATGTALYTGAAALAPEKVNAGPLQTLGRAAPYLTSAALGGAAALQSGDAEAGKLDALGRAAPYLATGALGAAMMTPQDTQAYNDYIRDEMEARTAADKFTQMRGSKAGYWEARRQELLDMVNGLGEMANNVVLPALDKPLQGYLGLAGTAGALAAGGTWDQAIQRGAMSAQRDSGQTFDAMGNSVAQAVAPISTPQQAQAIGNGVELGLNAATMFFSP